MTTVVCDASPLIFLAKLDRPEIIRTLLGGDVVVLQSVRIVDFTATTYQAGRLSVSDGRTLTYAVNHRADWFLAGERQLRRIAAHEGIATIGTLGLLVAAVRRGLLTRKEAMDAVDTAISSHHLRISIALYREFQRELQG